MRGLCQSCGASWDTERQSAQADSYYFSSASFAKGSMVSASDILNAGETILTCPLDGRRDASALGYAHDTFTPAGASTATGDDRYTAGDEPGGAEVASDGGTIEVPASIPTQVFNAYTLVEQATEQLQQIVTVITPPPPDERPSLDPILELLLGPQLPLGSEEIPWPQYDVLALGFAESAVAAPETKDDYYDFPRNQYVLYHRSVLAGAADERWISNARRSADQHYSERSPLGTGVAPRTCSMSGMILRALDGRSEMWPWILQWTNHHLWNWCERRIANTSLHYGMRDGGLAFTHACEVAAGHPDEAVRSEYEARCLTVAKDYYGRLQYGDGGWYWGDSAVPYFAKADGTGKFYHSQPFQVGLMLRGMAILHQLTGDADVLQIILDACAWLNAIYRTDTVGVGGVEVGWRGNWYFVVEPGATLEAIIPTTLDECSAPGVVGGYVVQGSVCLGGDSGVIGTGWDTNEIRDVRQLVPLNLHIFGYAYQVTADPQYKEWGDEQFAACFGSSKNTKADGPLADNFYCLADYIYKTYNQAMQSSAEYLRRRLG